MEQYAFLFDLDGVITDTAKLHEIAWKKLADELGLLFTSENNQLLKGVNRQHSLEIILRLNGQENKYSDAQKQNFLECKNRYYTKLLEDTTTLNILPGVLPFLNQCRDRNMKLAVASASCNAQQIIQLLNLEWLFDYIADAKSIAQGKPNPEVFLTCAHALKIPKSFCLCFEDSQVGIEAIYRAGMYSVGINVPSSNYLPNLNLISTQELEFNFIINNYHRFKKYEVKGEQIL